MNDVASIVKRMGDFAATTKNDTLSVMVSRAANRLAHQGAVCEEPLTEAEIAVINRFIKKA